MTVALEQYRASGIEQAVGRLNASFAPLRSIAELQGANKDQFMSTVLYEMNLKTGSAPGREGVAEPWFGSLNRAVDNGVDTWARLWAARQASRIKGGGTDDLIIDGVKRGARLADRVLTDVSERFGPGPGLDWNPSREVVGPETRNQAQRMWDYFSGMFPTREQTDKQRSRGAMGVE
jgi:hypothetical protein